MEQAIADYRMNPAEDRIIFGDELAEDMWVLPEDPGNRLMPGGSEDDKLRGQRFRRVTRLRREPGFAPGLPERTIFVAEWIDGYQEVHRHSVGTTWIVKKDAITATEGIDG